MNLSICKCKVCGLIFSLELDLILHFNREHITYAEGEGDCDDNSDSCEEKSGDGVNPGWGEETGFLYDVERTFLLEKLKEEEEQAQFNADQDKDHLPVPVKKFKRVPSSERVGVEVKAHRRNKFPLTSFRTFSGKKPTRPDYECIFCGLRVARHNQFCDHLRVHTHEKPYFCSDCDQSFTRRDNLSLHMVTHFSPKRRQSKKDEEKRSRKAGDDVHQRMCQVCDMTFSKKENLTRHLRIHCDLGGESIKRYKCKWCPKSFSRSDHRNSHTLAAHFREKPFECEHCQRSFPIKNYLDQHVKRVHMKSEHFGCLKCRKTFAWKYTLQRHIQKFHPVRVRKKGPVE